MNKQTAAETSCTLVVCWNDSCSTVYTDTHTTLRRTLVVRLLCVGMTHVALCTPTHILHYDVHRNISSKRSYNSLTILHLQNDI